MSPALSAREFDLRKESSARLEARGQRLGRRLAETLGEAMEAWLGAGFHAELNAVTVVSGFKVEEEEGVSFSVALGPEGSRAFVQGALPLFFYFFETMCSGAAPAAPAKRRVGETELTLGAELGARWLRCLPGLKSRPAAPDVRVNLRSEEEGPSSAQGPLLMFELELTQGPEGARALRFYVPSAWLEDSSVPAEKAPSPARFQQATVRLQAVLAPIRLKLKDLYNLRIGDCVLLDKGMDDPALLYLGHQKVYLARPGRQGRHLAVQIIAPLSDQP